MDIRAECSNGIRGEAPSSVYELIACLRGAASLAGAIGPAPEGRRQRNATEMVVPEECASTEKVPPRVASSQQCPCRFRLLETFVFSLRGCPCRCLSPAWKWSDGSWCLVRLQLQKFLRQAPQRGSDYGIGLVFQHECAGNQVMQRLPFLRERCHNVAQFERNQVTNDLGEETPRRVSEGEPLSLNVGDV